MIQKIELSSVVRWELKKTCGMASKYRALIASKSRFTLTLASEANCNSHGGESDEMRDGNKQRRVVPSVRTLISKMTLGFNPKGGGKNGVSPFVIKIPTQAVFPEETANAFKTNEDERVDSCHRVSGKE